MRFTNFFTIKRTSFWMFQFHVIRIFLLRRHIFSWKLFFLLSFLSGPFTNHRATEEGGGNLFKYSLPLHRNLGISLNFATENLPLHIASRRTRTRNLWFASLSHQPLGYTPLKLNPLFQLINGTWISNLACNLRNIICWCT